MKHKILSGSCIITIICALLLTACNKIKPAESDISAESTTESVTETVQTTKETETAAPETTEEEQAFIGGDRDYNYEKDLVFVGDSICSGLKVYSGLLSESQVYAVGNVGSWSIFDYKFPVRGGEYSPVDVIKRRQPKYIYLWMGMNDLNIVYKEKYAENMIDIADKFLEVSPYSKIVFVSITPINKIHPWCEEGKFDYNINDRINEFNSYMQSKAEKLDSNTYSYLNIHDLFTDKDGFMKDEYHSGDGLHLSPESYSMILQYIAQHEVKYDGSFPVETTEFPYIKAPTQTTVQTTSEATETVPQETTEVSETEVSETEVNSDTVSSDTAPEPQQ